MAGISRAEVNARLKTINIKGKPYVGVDARVLAFWDVFPEGAIHTEWLERNEERCTCMAHVYNMGVEIATGTASEERNASPINKTSYIENCETSAVGRALGFAGIGTDGSIASAEEVAAAIGQQEAASKRKKAEPKKEPEAQGLIDLATARSRYETIVRHHCDVSKQNFSDMIAKHVAYLHDKPYSTWSADDFEHLAAAMEAKYQKEAGR